MKYGHDKSEINLKNSKERDRMYARFDDLQKQLFSSIKDKIFTYCEAYCEFLGHDSMGCICKLEKDYRGRYSALAESYQKGA